MKKLLMILAGIAVMATPVRADSTVTVPDNFKQTMQQTQTTFQLCVGAVALHGSTDACAAVANMLAQLGGMTLTPIVPTPPVAVAPSTPAQIAPPAEAQKKSEGDVKPN